MERRELGRGPLPEARMLIDAYDELIQALQWERERFLKRAKRLAADQGRDKASRFLAAQAAYIREQALR